MTFGDGMSAHGFIGYNNTKFYGQITNDITAGVSNFSETLNAWVFGLGGEFNFGPMYLKPQASYYINGGSGGWLGGAAPGGGATQGAALRGTDVIDANSIMAMLAMGFSPTEQLTLELGGGYLYNKAKDSSVLDDQSFYEVYLQAVYAMAPGVYLVPEIGYRDYGDVR